MSTFMNDAIYGHPNLYARSTCYPQIIATLAADGYDRLITNKREEWFALITHPSLVEYTTKNLEVENGIASFTMYGIKFIYKGEKK